MKTVMSFLVAFTFCIAFIGCSEEVNRPFKDKTSSTEKDFKFLPFEVGDTTVKMKWDSQGFGESDTVSLFYDEDIVGANGTAISENIALSKKEYLWDISKMTEGKYFVYATFSDPSIKEKYSPETLYFSVVDGEVVVSKSDPDDKTDSSTTSTSTSTDDNDDDKIDNIDDEGNKAPTFNFIEPFITNETMLKIRFIALDADDEAKVSLYFDYDNKGNDGLLIIDTLVEGKDAEYLWNVSKVKPTQYPAKIYIYGTIDDDNHELVTDYTNKAYYLQLSQDANTGEPITIITAEETTSTSGKNSPIGGECTTDTDCAGYVANGNIFCYPATDQNGQATGFDKGYCMAACSYDDPTCPANSLCHPVLDDNGGVSTDQSTGQETWLCMAICQNAAGCRANYSCVHTVLGADICLPAPCTTNADCSYAPGLTCDISKGNCVNSGTKITATHGDACTTSNDCVPEEGICMEETTDAQNETVWKGGYCTALGCSIEFVASSQSPAVPDTCAANDGTCVPVGGFSGQCVASCSHKNDCTRNGTETSYYCYPTSQGGICLSNGCQADNDCLDSAGADVGLKCNTVTGHPRQGNCEHPSSIANNLFPQTDTDINGETKKIGDACTKDSDCPYRSLCIEENMNGQSTGFVGGYCSLFSCTDAIDKTDTFNACPSSGQCIPWDLFGFTTLCLDKCSTPGSQGDCRASYTCYDIDPNDGVNEGLCVPSSFLGP